MQRFKVGRAESGFRLLQLVTGSIAKELAYSRHSNFPVGAALLTQSGRIIRGASIDNAAYGAWDRVTASFEPAGWKRHCRSHSVR